ncbi:MAG TPA: hypothetical protein VK027_03605 [Chitinophagaceae bacterium]|nr:hypothetical protein [Chitinophagaceae bacterium]
MNKILKLLPHRDPFVLVSNLLESTSSHTITQFQIDKNQLLVENNVLSAAGLIENMAQTAAAGLAYQSQLGKDTDQNPTVGYIGQIKNLKIYFRPEIGSVIETKTTNVHQVMNAHIVDAEVLLGEDIVARAEVRVFLPS